MVDIGRSCRAPAGLLVIGLFAFLGLCVFSGRDAPESGAGRAAVEAAGTRRLLSLGARGEHLNLLSETKGATLQPRTVLRPKAQLRGQERLEAKIARIRGRLRGEPSGGWPAGEADEPQNGEVAYWDAGLFRQSYRLFEEHFRIFVYPDGDPGYHLTHWGPHKDIYGLDGMFFNNLVAGNNFVTSDPEIAMMFFLPLSIVNLVLLMWEEEEPVVYMDIPYPHTVNRGRIKHYVSAYMTHIAKEYKYWNRFGGRDHFMLSCHDWAPHIAAESHKGLGTRAMHVVCNANASEPEWGFQHGKDVSMPEVVMRQETGKGKAWGFEVKGGKPAGERDILAFYAGQTLGPTRAALLEHWGGGRDADMQVFDVESFRGVAERESDPGGAYDDRMRSARFCICPAGSEVSSPRITESLLKGCVPVIISEGFELPFWEVLDWSRFSFRFGPQDIPRLKELLESIPYDEWKAKHEQVQVVQKHFTVNYPPKKYDVFHMILHSVWLRRLNVTLAADS